MSYLETKRNALLNSVASSNVISWEALADESITEAVSSSITSFKRGIFNFCTNLEKISLPNATSTILNSATNGWGIAQECSSLRFLNLTNLEDMGALSSQFAYCTSLKVLYLPKAYGTGASIVNGCTSLEKFICPKHNTTNVTNSFAGCTSLKLIDMKPSRIAISLTSTVLETVILRSTSVPTLSNTSNIPNDTCVFYVPSSLVASYKSANNWSSLPNINDRILALEGSDYESETWFESTQEYRTEVLGE